MSRQEMPLPEVGVGDEKLPSVPCEFPDIPPGDLKVLGVGLGVEELVGVGLGESELVTAGLGEGDGANGVGLGFGDGTLTGVGVGRGG